MSLVYLEERHARVESKGGEPGRGLCGWLTTRKTRTNAVDEACEYVDLSKDSIMFTHCLAVP